MARYTVKLFGPQARLAQQREVAVDLPGEPAAVADLLAAVGVACPALADSIPTSKLAVNQAFAHSATKVTPSDEVALIGMLGGG